VAAQVDGKKAEDDEENEDLRNFINSIKEASGEPSWYRDVCSISCVAAGLDGMDTTARSYSYVANLGVYHCGWRQGCMTWTPQIST
jgi:hypothetical protein